MCVKSSRSASPVEGCWVPLGLAAEHHLSSVLAGMKWEHHTAGLFGERGPQQDSTSCTKKQQSSISFDVAVDLETNFHVFSPFFFFHLLPLFSRFPRLLGRRVWKRKPSVKLYKWKESLDAIKINVWHISISDAHITHTSCKSCCIPQRLYNEAGNLENLNANTATYIHCARTQRCLSTQTHSLVSEKK